MARLRTACLTVPRLLKIQQVLRCFLSTRDAKSLTFEYDALVTKLGVRCSPELLRQAITHRSYAYENDGFPHNERLEFLGDSILGQAVTVALYNEFPDSDEGELAKRRASLVSSAALAEIARGIELGEHLLLGKGEDRSGGRDKTSILADTVEAIIGAVYLDAGGDAATELVLRLVAPLRSDPHRFGAAMDPKTSLQEIAAEQGYPAPVYSVSTFGPDHSRIFRARVVVGDCVSEGEGTSKKHAEMAAALSAWEMLTGRRA